MMTINSVVLDSDYEHRVPLLAVLRELGQHRIWIARDVGRALHLLEMSHHDNWCLVEPLGPIQAVFVRMSLSGGFDGERLMRAVKDLDRERKWQTFVVGVMDDWDTERACRSMKFDWRLRSPVNLDDAATVIHEMTKKTLPDPLSGVICL